MKYIYTYEEPIKYRDKVRRYEDIEPEVLFDYCRLLLLKNDFRLRFVDRKARILDTKIMMRSKINIKITDYSLVRVNIEQVREIEHGHVVR